MYMDPQDVYEAAWRLLFSEVSADTKELMMDALARAFEGEYARELQEEAEREAKRRNP